ncbi:MAG TPA: hypothetical protein DFR83_02465 [Deltaproteobacteria bacterium]|nr:hypothetical protein [Deltaproteobacteria bacterium]
MNLAKLHVSFRPLEWAVLLSGLAFFSACKEEPQGRFVQVDQVAELLEVPPDDAYYGLDYAGFGECPYNDWAEVSDINPDTQEELTRTVEDGTVVEGAAYDTLTDDCVTADSVLITALSRTLEARDSTQCGPDGQPPPAPLFCDAISDPSTVVPDDVAARICDPWWTECFAALSDLDRDDYQYAVDGSSEPETFSNFFYVNDARYTPLPSADIQAKCTCSSSPEDLIAAHDAMEESYDWALYYKLFYGDSTITIQNDANNWGPFGEADSSNGNAGICGAWLFSDAAFQAIAKPGPEDEPSELQQFCGGIAVQDIASGSEVAAQPLTTLWLGRTNTDRNLRLGGFGDLTNAWVLAGRDDASRACPDCDPGRGDRADSCSVSTGAARLLFSDDLRYRVGSDSKVHLLMAECAPRVDSVELGWQQACWHAEIPRVNLDAGNHTLVKVGGIGAEVARDTSVLD